MIGYLYDTKIMESMLGITGLSINLRDMSTAQKNGYLGNRLDITIKEKQMNLNRTFFTQLLTDIMLLYTMLAIK